MIHTFPVQILWLAFAFYAFAFFAIGFFPKSDEYARPTRWFAIAALLAQTSTTVWLFAAAPAGMCADIYGTFELVGLAAGGLALAGIVFKRAAVAKISTAAAALFCAMPMCCPHFSSRAAENAPQISTIVLVHIVFACLSYAIMAAAAAAATAYMVKYTLLKNGGNASDTLPKIPLERLNKRARIATICAAASMFVSLLFGIAAAARITPEPAFIMKICAGSAVFAVQIFAAATIVSKNIKDITLAKFCVALFAFAVVALAPIIAK